MSSNPEGGNIFSGRYLEKRRREREVEMKCGGIAKEGGKEEYVCEYLFEFPA